MLLIIYHFFFCFVSVFSFVFGIDKDNKSFTPDSLAAHQPKKGMNTKQKYKNEKDREHFVCVRVCVYGQRIDINIYHRNVLALHIFRIEKQ